MPTNTKESGLETLIVDWLVDHNSYEQDKNADYNSDYAIDETRLFRFFSLHRAVQWTSWVCYRNAHLAGRNQVDNFDRNKIMGLATC